MNKSNLYNSKDYKTNRHAVILLRQKVLSETVTTTEAITMGAKKVQLAKWVKEGKLRCISFGGKKRYLVDMLKELILGSIKQD
jgi:hypothetical protein